MTSEATKKRARKVESIEDLNQQIVEMEAELAEQHQNALPRLIHAARAKRLELEKRHREECLQLAGEGGV
jgi:hypothetical protein